MGMILLKWDRKGSCGWEVKNAGGKYERCLEIPFQ